MRDLLEAALFMTIMIIWLSVTAVFTIIAGFQALAERVNPRLTR